MRTLAPSTPGRWRATKIARAIIAGLFLAHAAGDEHRGVINDPDGYVNVRSDKQIDAPIVATVKLILQRHEYFEKLKPTTIEGRTFKSIHDFGRLYEITVTVEPDNRANVTMRLREDR